MTGNVCAAQRCMLLRLATLLPICMLLLSACGATTPTTRQSSTPAPLFATATPTALPATSGVAVSALVAYGRAFVSTDGGATWQDVTPPSVTGSNSSLAVDFITDSVGWVAVCHNSASTAPSVVTVYSTSDGGQSWRHVALPTQPFPTERIGNLRFIDARVGWLVVDQTQTSNAYTSMVYGTTDGGATWTQNGQVPLSGTVSFVSPSEGWFAGSQAAAPPNQLDHTRDGGHTWQQVNLPLPAQTTAPYALGAPAFFDARNGTLPLAQGVTVELLLTHDGGATWTVGPVYTVAGMGSSPPLAVTLSTHGWVIIGKYLFFTTDTGQTWAQVPYTISPQGADLSGVSALTFVSGGTGWALCATGSDTQALYLTVNGGQTWTQSNVPGTAAI